MPSSSRLFFLFLCVGLSTSLAGCGGGGGNGGPPPPPPPPPSSLAISFSPPSLTMVPNSSVTITISATESGTTATPTVTISSLPTGVTTNATFPISVPAGGASITVQTTNNAAPGNYAISFNGQAGTASTTAGLPINILAIGSALNLTASSTEVLIPIGSSQQLKITASTFPLVDYNVFLGIIGLPPGVTASFNPTVIVPGQNSTLTLTAASNAPAATNVPITVTGSPTAPVTTVNASFLAQIGPPPGSLANNRTDYVSTGGTIAGAVYDAVHKLIFSSNRSWDKVDVISTTTHAIQTSISVRSPLGVDITQDGSTVWVTTESQMVYEINTVTFAAKQHLLPDLLDPGAPFAHHWVGHGIYALSDGTLLLESGFLADWDPTSNALTELTIPQGTFVGIVRRSGNAKRLYSISADSSGDSYYYDVQTKSFSPILHTDGYSVTIAINQDATRVAIGSLGQVPKLYDGNLNLIGVLPGGGVLGIEGESFFQGGMVFSSDNQFLYEICMPTNNPIILKINANTGSGLTAAPALPMIPVSFELGPPFYMAEPFGVDSTGLVFGIQDFGIAFDDSSDVQNFVIGEPGNPTFLQHMSPYVGPIAGGTTSGGFGNSFSFAPDVWYGGNRGIAQLDSGGSLTITSPAGSALGPVNIKFLFPDGTEAFDPLFFSYGPVVQYAVMSGASPSGGVTGQIAGFGLPTDGTGGTLTVGGTAATIIPTPSFGAPHTGEPFPTFVTSYTVPAGSPGWVDIALTTPNGNSTLPKSFFYAQSVTDHSSADTFRAVLFDPKRQQVYLSAGDHIDVFSLGSNTFLTPLQPPAQGAAKRFMGLSMTPDGSELLAADMLDGSIAVINPDNPPASIFIPVVPAVTQGSCTNGPVNALPIPGNKALALYGYLPEAPCQPGGALYTVDLTSHASSPTFIPQSCNASGAQNMAGSHDGTKIALTIGSGGGPICIYDPVQNTGSANANFPFNAAAISGDGNVAASLFNFLDASAKAIGGVAKPSVYFNAFAPGILNTLNDSGSLYFVPYQNSFDIIDVQHGTVRIRFSLNETISSIATAPMAIDSGGRRIFLITNQGLTIVDLGVAPLSIGSLNATTASAGSQITLRGSGFAASTIATIDGISATVTFTDENTLTLTIPAVSLGPATIVLKNSDGTQYTLGNLLIIQ
jgi:hypothetical protein